MKRKLLFTLLIVVCIVINILVLPVSAEVAAGTYGENLKWSFDTASGTLTISGTGIATGLPQGSNEGYMQYYSDIRHIIIADGITEIEGFAFHHFFYLDSIRIGNTVKVIGESAFADNYNATQLYLGKSVTTIGENAFGTMEKLQSLVLPPSVQNIGLEAFALSGISSVSVPEGVTVLETNVFRHNRNLSHIMIPVSVKHIKNGAFRDCEKLKDVYYAGTQAQWEAINIENSEEIVGDAKGGGNTYLLSATVHYNHTHDWNSGKVITEPTCNSEGIKTYDCVCGTTKTETVAKLSQHNWDSGTKNADSAVIYHCTLCDATKTESLSAPDHQDTDSNKSDNTPGQLENEDDAATSVTEETLSQTDKESGDVVNPADAPTETFGGNNTTEQAGIEKEQPKGFPWVAICIGAAVLLAGGGTAAWFMLRKKP